MSAPEMIWEPVMLVNVTGTVPVEPDSILSMLRMVIAPRPGQEFTVRILHKEYSAEVVYIGHPDAPAYKVTYLQLAQAWGDLLSEDEIRDLHPQHLDLAEALQVVDRACMHLAGAR